MQITGLVLAGGQGRRMGGVDKGLQPFGGVTLAGHALRRLRPQVSSLLVSANRHVDQYAAWGHPVVVDRIGGHAGPLAGVHAALSQIQTDWLLCVPCDAPWFPEDLAVCLSDAVARGGCLAAVACSPAVGGAVILQPTFCLLHRTLRTSVESFLHSGEHKAALWLDSVAAARVVFSPGDHGDMFANLNTQVELDRAREA